MSVAGWIKVVLLIAALVCFLLAAFSGYTRPDSTPGWARANFIGFGLALLTIVWLIDAFTLKV